MNILRFSQFVNENLENTGYQDFVNLPDSLKNLLTKWSSSNMFSKIIGNRNFRIDLEGEDVYFTLNGKKVLFPFIKCQNGNSFFDLEVLEDPDSYEKFFDDLGISNKDRSDKGYGYTHTGYYSRTIIAKLRGESTGYYERLSLEEIFGSYFLSSLYSIIANILSSSSKDEFLNPFTLDLNNNPLIKNLKKLGLSIVSTERQRKNGTIQFRSSHNFMPHDLTVHSNGYMRRVADRTSPVTKNLELSRPIYTEDDLNLKLTYIWVYCLKLMLKHFGVATGKVNSIIKSITSGDNFEYDELIKRIASEDPTVAHLLPDPNSVLDPSIVRGASILSRFNAI